MSLSVVVIASVTKAVALTALIASALIAAVLVGDRWDARGGGL